MSHVTSLKKTAPLASRNLHPLTLLQTEMDNALASFNRWFDPTTFSLNYRTEDFERLTLLPSKELKKLRLKQRNRSLKVANRIRITGCWPPTFSKEAV